MPAEFPIVGPPGPPGIQGDIGPALLGGTRKYAQVAASGASGYTLPDSADVSFADHFRVEALVLPTSWTAAGFQVLAAKWATTATGRSYHLYLAATGDLGFQWSSDGTGANTLTHTSTVTIPSVLRSDGPVWVAATFSGTTGPTSDAVVNFYYSIDDTATWIQLGASNVRNPGHIGGTVFDNATQVTTGRDNTVGTTGYAGRLYRVRLYDITVPASPVQKAELDTRFLAGSTSDYTDQTGKTWTHEASTSLLSDEWNVLDTRQAKRVVHYHSIIPGIDGYVLQVSAGKAEWVSPGGTASLILSVKEYGGATGDGTTDDTTAFTLTIAAVAAAGGGIVYVPKPLVAYKVTSAIDLNGVSNITIRGDGKRLSKIIWAGGYGTTTTNTVFLIRGTSGNIIIEHLSVDGQKNLLPTATVAGGSPVSLSTTPTDVPVSSVAGFAASGTVKMPDWTGVTGGGNPASNVVWKTVTYTGVNGGTNTLLGCTLSTGTASVPVGSTVQIGAGGLGMNIASTGTDIRVRWCRITNCATHGVFHANQTDIEFSDCQIDGNGSNTSAEAAPTSGGEGIHDNGGSLRSAVRNCWIFGNTGTGVGHANTAGAPQACDVTGCMVYNNYFIGIAGGSNGIGMIVRGNRLMNNVNNNIDMGGCNQFVVADNYSLGSRTGIDVDGGTGFTATDGTITGNTVTGSLARYGIAAVRFKNITITGNTVSNCFWDGINVGSAAGTCTSAVITGNLVRNSGQDGGGTRSGIHINNVTDVTVTGNRCDDDQVSKTQQYGVQSIGTSDYVTVTGNTLRGNAAGAQSLVGVNNQVGVNS